MQNDSTAQIDPRTVRTRRDVVQASAALLVEAGWDGVTHAEVARRSGYSKATVYAHWPTRFDLVRASIDRICDEAEHPAPTGDLRVDLRAGLLDFAHDLSEGHLDRLLAGVVEHAGQGQDMADLRLKLYETGTRAMRAVLATHLAPADVEPVLVLLTGAILVHVSYAGQPATPEFVDDLIRRVTGS